MLRPLLRRPSQTAACGYVCRRCRHHLAQQAPSRPSNAFSTSATRWRPQGDLGETDQDHFGGFNDLSEEYSSSNFLRKPTQSEAMAAQRSKEDDSPAAWGSSSVRLAQEVDGDEDVGEGEVSSAKDAGAGTVLGRAEDPSQHLFAGLDLPGQAKIDRASPRNINSDQRESRRKLLAGVGVVEWNSSIFWLDGDGRRGPALTKLEISGKRNELQEKLKQIEEEKLSRSGTKNDDGTTGPDFTKLESAGKRNELGQKLKQKEEESSSSGAKTAFARAKSRPKHPLHGLQLNGQKRLDRGLAQRSGGWGQPESLVRLRKRILANHGVVDIGRPPYWLAWRKEDGTTWRPLSAQEAVAKRAEIEAALPNYAEEVRAVLGKQGGTLAPETHMADPTENVKHEQADTRTFGSVEGKFGDGPESSRRETFEGILAKLQAGLPRRIAAFNAAKQSKAAVEDDVDVPTGVVANHAFAPEGKPSRVANPFLRPVYTVSNAPVVVRKLRTREPEVGSGSHPGSETEPKGLVSRQPSQRTYNFSRQTGDVAPPALAARVRATNMRSAAWGGISPAVKPVGEIKVDSDSLRAIDGVSRITPKAASPGQNKAWGQELVPFGGVKKASLPPPKIGPNTDNLEMLAEPDKESDKKSGSKADLNRPNTSQDLGRPRNHTLGQLKAAWAQAMDGKRPDGQTTSVQQTSVKEKEKPRKQVSIFRRLMDGLTGASSYCNQENNENDAAPAGHLAPGEKAVERRTEEEKRTIDGTADHQRQQSLGDAPERLATLHAQSPAAVAPSAGWTTSGPVNARKARAQDQEADVRTNEVSRGHGTQATEADDSSAAGQELMFIRKRLSFGTVDPIKDKAKARTRGSWAAENATSSIQEGEQRMSIQEAILQGKRPPKDQSVAPHAQGLRERGSEHDTAMEDEPQPEPKVPADAVTAIDIKSILPAELSVNHLDIPQPDVPPLQYGLDRVLFNPGVYQLQDPHSRVYNFDPFLQKVTPIKDFDFNALKEYKTSSQDQMLSRLAQKHGKKYVGSTSSMTSTLAHFHYLLSSWREINLDMLSRGFQETVATFTQINRAPTAIFLRWKNGTYAIDADKEYDGANVLMMLGKSMEKLLTVPREEYERYTRGSTNVITQAEKDEPETYEYTSMGDFLMRSQLDAYDSRLPGNGTFDLKTRAVVSIRMDVEDFEPMLGYQLHTLQGTFESYEREYYDMIRSTMLKYMLQARMGRMDGIFVAYHNIERIFGFQYLPLAELDRAIHGQIDTCLGDQEFKASLKLLNEVFEMATEKFPGQSLRFHFESADKPADIMWVFAEPVTEEEADAIQSTSKAKVAEFERSVMGIEKSSGKETAAGLEDESGDSGTLQADSEAAEIVHSDPLSAYAAAKAKPASPSRDSNPKPTNLPKPTNPPSSSHADVQFMRKLSANLGDHTKPLFAATIILKNHVNDGACENNRPRNLTKSDKWRVDYVLREARMSEKEKWARYEDLKARRKKVFEREEEGLEEEGGGKVKKVDWYITMLRELAQRGRVFRKRAERAEEGREKVVVGEPSGKGYGGGKERRRDIPAEEVVRGNAEEQVEVRNVKSFMKWLFPSADEKPGA